MTQVVSSHDDISVTVEWTRWGGGQNGEKGHRKGEKDVGKRGKNKEIDEKWARKKREE